MFETEMVITRLLTATLALGGVTTAGLTGGAATTSTVKLLTVLA